MTIKLKEQNNTNNSKEEETNDRTSVKSKDRNKIIKIIVKTKLQNKYCNKDMNL